MPATSLIELQLIQLITSILIFYLFSNIRDNFFIVVLAFKLGLPPFHHWFLTILTKTKLLVFAFLLSIQKMPGLSILSSLRNRKIIELFSLISLFLIFYILNINNILYITASVAILSNNWLLIAPFSNFWLAYIILFVIFIIFFVFITHKTKNTNMASLVLIIRLLGIPPRRIFFIKFDIIITLGPTPFITLFLFLTPVILFKLIIYYFNLSYTSKLNIVKHYVFLSMFTLFLL